MERFKRKLKQLNIPLDSDLGRCLKTIDDSYNELDVLELKIKNLIVKREQLKDDIDMMEMMFMHKYNKDSRGGYR